MTTSPTFRSTAAEEPEEPEEPEDEAGEAPGAGRRAAARPGRAPRAAARTFAWTLPNPLKGRFELWVEAGSRPLARLTIGGLAFADATLEAGEHRLLLTAEGVGNRRVAIADAATRKVVADFEWHRPGHQGTLRLVDGGQLEWRRTGRWHPTFTFMDRFGNLLVRLRPDGRALGYGSSAHPEPGPEPSPSSPRDLALLLALGWFLLVSGGTAARLAPAATG